MLNEDKWMKIRELKNQGLSISEIARQLGMNRKTIRNNLKKETAPKYSRKKTITLLDDFKDYLRLRLEEYNISSFKLFEEIIKQGYKGKYDTVNNFVKEIKKSLKQKAIIRFETLPGEQSQVDWGYCGKIYDIEKRKEIKVNCFVMILGYSRYRYVEFFEDQKIDSFLQGHNNAFKYFGGYTREILYDNLKLVVIKRMLKAKDSEFNKRFLDFSGYYGFKAILARPYKPQTKGKVENTVKYVKENFWKGEKFKSLKEINKKIKYWLEKVNNKIHWTTKEKPVDRLKKETLTSIKNMQLFDLTKTYYRKVFSDSHFLFETNHYSMPIKYIGKEIAIKVSKNTIFASYRDKKVVEHTIEKTNKYVYITKQEHYNEIKKQIYKTRKKTKGGNNNDLKTKKIDLIHNKSAETEDVKKRDLKIYEGV